MPSPKSVLPSQPSTSKLRHAKTPPERSGDLFIVDNSDEQWKGLR